MNTLVEVLVDLDNGTTKDVVAKIVEVKRETYMVKYLSPTKKLYGSSFIYKYEKEVYEIDKESVSGFFDSTKEEDAGFVHLESGGWILEEGRGDSSDYEPASDAETTTDESVTESEEEINPE
jgi:hypothetical protein